MPNNRFMNIRGASPNNFKPPVPKPYLNISNIHSQMLRLPPKNLPKPPPRPTYQKVILRKTSVKISDSLNIQTAQIVPPEIPTFSESVVPPTTSPVKENIIMEIIPINEQEKSQERLEKERLEKENLEKERLEKERLEKERLESERLEKEKLDKERLEKEEQEKEKLEKERLEKEKLDKERLEKEEQEKKNLDAKQQMDEWVKAEKLKADLKKPNIPQNQPRPQQPAPHRLSGMHQNVKRGKGGCGCGGRR